MDTVDTVVFDIGGVLEVGEVIDRGGYPSWLAEIGASRGLDQTEVQARMRTVTGDLSEAELRSGYARALDLDEHTAYSFMAHLWDWYCGELNVKLWNWAVGLARTHRLAICSNSADGARREEERRYGFSRLFDPIVYSHEVGTPNPTRGSSPRCASRWIADRTSWSSSTTLPSSSRPRSGSACMPCTTWTTPPR